MATILNRIVDIYIDPLTEQKWEGRAVLVKKLYTIDTYNGRQYERWRVRFLEDVAQIERNWLVPAEKGIQEPPLTQRPELPAVDGM